MSSTQRHPQVSAARRAVVKELDAPPKRRVLIADDGDVAAPRFAALSPQDRAFAERIYRGVLQNLRLIDWLADRCGSFDRARTPITLLWILRVAVYQKVFLGGVPDYAIGQQSVDHARELAGPRAAGFINALIRSMVEKLPGDQAGLDATLAEAFPEGVDPALRYSVPDDIAHAFGEAYGKAVLPGLLKSLGDQETRVWIRPNILKLSIEALHKRFAAEKVALEASDLAPGILRWVPGEPGAVAPWKADPWRQGECTVQDLGAMLAVWMLAPKTRESIVDYCAAPGGKAGQIWEQMEGKGNLVAYEVDSKRRHALKHTLSRLYGPYNSIRLPAPDEEVSKYLTSHGKLADAILVDAPCLALGLIRRHPEIRWDKRLNGAGAAQEVQLRILTKAAHLLAPGGRLVWSTCSPTRLENDDVLAEFLKTNQGYSLVDPAPSVPAFARPWTQIHDRIVRTRPDLAPVDAFAAAILGKNT